MTAPPSTAPGIGGRSECERYRRSRPPSFSRSSSTSSARSNRSARSNCSPKEVLQYHERHGLVDLPGRSSTSASVPPPPDRSFSSSSCWESRSSSSGLRRKGQLLMKRTLLRRHQLQTLGRVLLNIPLMVVILVPLLYTLSISVMQPDEIYTNRLIPSSVSFENYVRALTGSYYNFPRMILTRSSSRRPSCLVDGHAAGRVRLLLSGVQGKRVLFLAVLAR